MKGSSNFGLSFICGLAFSLAACARDAPLSPRSNVPSPPVASSSTPPNAGSDAPPDMAPTPYSSDEIRAANRPGTIYRYKVEKAGEPSRIEVLQIKTASADTVELETQELDEAGKALQPARVDKATWEELRRHAEFPRASLAVEVGVVDVPAGKFDVNVYTVRTPNGDTMRFHFAKSYAGPPVLFWTERGATRVMTQTLIERRSGR